jgi:hypothetical protein
MEDILYDYHVARAMASQHRNSDSPEFNETMYMQAVLKKHGTTQAVLDSSLIYYYGHVDKFAEIYQEVTERLNEEAMSLGASVGALGDLTTMSLTGDTANIWNGTISQVLVPYAPYNRLQYSLQADTAFRKGDSFMLTWYSNFLYQSGSKDAAAYMAIRYKNDSIASQTFHFSSDGISQLRMAGCDEPIKEIKGFIYLGQGYENTSAMRMLILNNIQLIRFHKAATVVKEPEPEKSVTDSLSQVPDSLRPKHHRLGERPDNIQPITR